MAPNRQISRTEVEAFTEGFDHFTRALRTARGRFNRAPAVPEVSTSQFYLLEPLATHEPLQIRALADAAGVAAPTASRMLDGLARRGLVERTRREAGDRRGVEIALTAEGRRLVTAKRARKERVHEEIFQRLSPRERRVAAHLLRSLAAAVDDLQP